MKMTQYPSFYNMIVYPYMYHVLIYTDAGHDNSTCPSALTSGFGCRMYGNLESCNLTIFNERAYLTFKSIFHKALNLF